MKRLSSIAVASLTLLPFVAPWPARAADTGEEAEITSGSVTGLSCALKAQKTGHLEELSSCPPSEAVKGLVVFDVAERAIYRLSNKKVHLYELERAFGGGSIDVSGVVVKVTDGVADLEVKQYSVTPKPKPGGFKGCL